MDDVSVVGLVQPDRTNPLAVSLFKFSIPIELLQDPVGGVVCKIC